jgi:bitesize isoform, putative
LYFNFCLLFSYVKLYLLPDSSKTGKRKTKIKKHTLNPVFNEVLKFNVKKEELDNRILWISVWHADIFGRNEFLGKLTLPLSDEVLKNSSLTWYSLQERVRSFFSHRFFLFN